MKPTFLLLSLCALLCSSCEKEEQPNRLCGQWDVLSFMSVSVTDDTIYGGYPSLLQCNGLFLESDGEGFENGTFRGCSQYTNWHGFPQFFHWDYFGGYMTITDRVYGTSKVYKVEMVGKDEMILSHSREWNLDDGTQRNVSIIRFYRNLNSVRLKMAQSYLGP